MIIVYLFSCILLWNVALSHNVEMGDPTSVDASSFRSATTSHVSEEEVEEFIQWIESQGIKHKLQVVDDEFGGKRTIATEDIEKGENILELPVKTLMSTVTAVESDLERVFKHPDYSKWALAPRSALALHILYERYNPNSKYRPYLNMLPKTEDTTILWSEKEKEELIGSFVYDRTEADLVGITDEYYSLFPNLFKFFPEIFTEEKYTYNDFLWAFSMIWSRAFALYIDDRMEMVMTPLGDLLNHKQSAKTKYQLNPVTQTYDISTDDGYKKGEEVFNNYGQKSNQFLLQLYGIFINNNPNASVQLELGLLPDDQQRDYKNMRLNEIGIFRADYPYSNLDVKIGGKPSDSLLAFLRIKHFRLPKSKQSQFREEFNKLDPYKKVSNANEAAVYHDIFEACSKQLQKYQTTIEEDQDIISKNQFKSKRHEKAVRMRLEEKLILKQMVEEIEKKE